MNCCTKSIVLVLIFIAHVASIVAVLILTNTVVFRFKHVPVSLQKPKVFDLSKICQNYCTILVDIGPKKPIPFEAVVAIACADLLLYICTFVGALSDKTKNRSCLCRIMSWPFKGIASIVCALLCCCKCCCCMTKTVTEIGTGVCSVGISCCCCAAKATKG